MFKKVRDRFIKALKLFFDSMKKYEFKAFMNKQYKKLKNHITPRSAGMIGVVLFAMVFFVVFSVKTVNDRRKYNKKEYEEIITRVPGFSYDLFLGEPPKSVIRLSWYDNIIKLKKDEPVELQLNAALYPVLVPDRTLIYDTSDSETAEIDQMGKITVKKPGSVEFTVRNEYTHQQAKAYLQIIQPVTGVYMDKSTINLYTTDMGMRLEAKIDPDNATNTTLKWYSKDSEIVSVDQTGHLKPGKTGLTEVVVTTADGGFKAKCFVNVINEVIKAKTVEILNKENIILKKGEKWTGIASVQPSNARNLNVEWSSSDNSVAAVTQTGIVTAMGEGTAEITARSADGPSDSITVTVTGGEGGTDINLNPSYEVSGGIRYTAYGYSLDAMTDIQLNTPQKYNDGNGFVNAAKEQVRMYLDPNEFGAGAYKYQFMELSHYNGISRDVLASFLEGKGVLSGKADAFIEAARKYNVSEVYLVAHACVETGYGTSQLANGIMVNGKRVYNVYGIRATDNAAVANATAKAYEEGWTDVNSAIIGGAKWISESYINNPQYHQNTLYKMRWNPGNPGQHQYATDISWAASQAIIIEKILNRMPGAYITYDIPVYAGSSAIEITY